MELAPGLKHVQSITVTEDMTPPHLRGDAIRVLATPDVVASHQTAIGRPTLVTGADHGRHRRQHQAPSGHAQGMKI
jgi:hypothetical protein